MQLLVGAFGVEETIRCGRILSRIQIFLFVWQMNISLNGSTSGQAKWNWIQLIQILLHLGQSLHMVSWSWVLTLLFLLSVGNFDLAFVCITTMEFLFVQKRAAWWVLLLFVMSSRKHCLTTTHNFFYLILNKNITKNFEWH